MDDKVRYFLQLKPFRVGKTSVTESEEAAESLLATERLHSGGGRAEESSYDSVGLEAKSKPFGDLSYAELREVYLQSSSVRPCVDEITRTISSLPWCVKTKPGGDIVHAHRVREFLMDPNSNKENIRTILTKILTDALVIDMGIIEKVYSRNKKNLLEIYARDGATFTPMYDKHGVLHSYRQRVKGNVIDFAKNENVLFQLYPRTWNFYGTPIIESITDEVTTLMHGVAQIGDSFMRDEIPSGILALDKIGQVAYRRLKSDLTTEKGMKKQRLRILRNAKDAKWIDFKRPFREQQVVELNNQIAVVVRRNFGLTEDLRMPATTMLAMCQMLNYYINREIISELYQDVYFKLMPAVTDEKEAKAKEARTRSYKNLINVLDPEDLRKLVEEEFSVAEEALD